jgi:hypothetical protein
MQRCLWVQQKWKFSSLCKRMDRTWSFITPQATNLCCPPHYLTEPFLSQGATSKLLFIFLCKSPTKNQETLLSTHNFCDKLFATPISVKTWHQPWSKSDAQNKLFFWQLLCGHKDKKFLTERVSKLKNHYLGQMCNSKIWTTRHFK